MSRHQSVSGLLPSWAWEGTPGGHAGGTCLPRHPPPHLQIPEENLLLTPLSVLFSPYSWRNRGPKTGRTCSLGRTPERGFGGTCLLLLAGSPPGEQQPTGSLPGSRHPTLTTCFLFTSSHCVNDPQIPSRPGGPGQGLLDPSTDSKKPQWHVRELWVSRPSLSPRQAFPLQSPPTPILCLNCPVTGHLLPGQSEELLWTV